MSARCAIVVLLAGCVPTNLLKATTAYGTASESTTTELGGIADVMTSICHERAESEYLSAQLSTDPHAASFTEFYEHERHEVAGLGVQSTWKDQCAAYRAVDQRFSTLVHAIGAYGAALTAFAADDADAGTPFGAVLTSIGKDVATELPAAAPYKSELSGAGEPVGRVATALQQRWKAKHIGGLVTTVDPDVQTLLAKLGGYVEAVRRREVKEARESIRDLVESLHAQVLPLASVPSTELAAVERRLTIEQQVVAASVEARLEGRLATFERRLAKLSDLIAQLRAAHTALAAGWQAGEDKGPATVTTITEIMREIRADIATFENPITGAGS